MTTEIKLIENKATGTYRVTINGQDAYAPFDDEIKAKAAAFDSAATWQMEGQILISYLSH